MHEPPFQFEPVGDGRPVVAYVVALGVLLVLPWFGVECLLSWCIVQNDEWIVFAFALAVPFLILTEPLFRLWDRLRGNEEPDA